MGAQTSQAADPQERYKLPQDSEKFPPIRPPRRSRRKLISNNSAFQAIDEHALKKAPVSARQSVKTLAQYLCKPANTDVERARAFYRWIADNIRYDVSSTFNPRHEDQQAEAVLRRGMAVCAGYSNLFLELCREVKIPCKKVQGFSKGASYSSEQELTKDSKVGHAWNLVYLSGQWGLVDTTWGAGSVRNQRFQKYYEDLYFLTDPKDFVVKHFPYEDNNMEKSVKLQLLKKSLSLEEFNKASNPSADGLLFGFRSVQKTHKVEMDGEFSTTFKTKVKMVDVTAKLKQRNSEINQHIILRKGHRGRIRVLVSPPREGKYELSIYGRSAESGGENLKQLITFELNCKLATPGPKYPDHFGLWGRAKGIDAKAYGFSGDFASKDYLVSKNGSFKLCVKAKDKTKALFKLANTEGRDVSKHAYGSVAGGYFTVEGYLPDEGYFKLTIFGNTGDRDRYTTISNILIECRKRVVDPPIYPSTGTVLGAKQNAEEYGFKKSIYSFSTFITKHGEITIRLPTSRDVTSSLKLESASPNMNTHERNAIGFYRDGVLSIKARLPKKGFYKLSLFARNPATPTNTTLDLVAEFLLESKADATDLKQFPKPYSSSETHMCQLLEPLSGKLKSNSEVRLRLRSRHLKKLLINEQTYDKKTGDLFDVTLTTPIRGTLPICGNHDAGERYDWLYSFDIV